MNSYIFLGLGNPGEEYENTRHNIGRIFIQKFAEAKKFPEFEFDKKLNSLVSSGKIKKTSVKLLLPETFMNKSGSAVKPLITSKAKAAGLCVIQDDLDLPFGRIKMVFNRSSGGHKGIESIMKAVGTEAFIRIRVGVSKEGSKGQVKKPDGEEAVIKFILGKFKPDELKEIDKRAKDIVETLTILAENGKDAAIQFCNSLK